MRWWRSLAPQAANELGSSMDMLDPDRRWWNRSSVRFPPSLRRTRPSREPQPYLVSARVEAARAGHRSIGDTRIGAGSGENGAAGYGSVWW